MYVQCERCKTEYDFDDALVSERGTTVKCTQCGHQFKVRRPEGSGATGDRWVVTTVSGKTLVFTSLRELQKAILGKQVARSDSLQRGGGAPRLLGAIAELEPFFDKRASVPPGEAEPLPVRRSSRPPPPAAATGLAPPQRTPSAPPRGRMDTLRPPGVPPQASPHQEPTTPVRSPLTSTSNAASSALSNTLQHMAPAVAQPMTAEPFAPRPIHHPEPSATLPAHAAQPALHGTMPMAPVRAQVRSTPPMMETSSPLPPQAMPMNPMRASVDSLHPGRPSIPDEAYAPKRRRLGGFIVATVLVGGVVLGGALLLKNQGHLFGGTKPTASLAPLDPKAQQLLSDGERAFADGNLNAAKEDFDKASVLADKDPRILLDVARVAAARADIAWLQLRIVLPGEPGTQAKKDLDELSVKASSAADAAQQAAPDDPEAARAKIDALRIAGDLAQARALYGKMGSIASKPDSAYVLAALDLAESPAPNGQVIDRLREAAASEGNLGRGRAALVYTLARTGDVAGARRELEKLVSLPRQHPLLGDLRAFLDRSTSNATGGDGGQVVDLNTLPLNGANTGGTTSFGASDPRTLLAQAESAKSHGDLLKAKELYGKVIAINANDSEALAGLGDVSYQQHDLPSAKTYYEHALRVNNTFFPARIGLADTEWDLGAKSAAQRMYKDMVDQMPEQMVPARARQRANEGAPAPTATATEGAP